MGETRFPVSLDHLTSASVILMQALSVLPEQTAEAEVRFEGGSLTLYLFPQRDFYIIILFHLQERINSCKYSQLHLENRSTLCFYIY